MQASRRQETVFGDGEDERIAEGEGRERRRGAGERVPGIYRDDARQQLRESGPRR